jgi:hypothetical protein
MIDPLNATDTEIAAKALRNARPSRQMSRRDLIQDLLDCGPLTARAICRRYNLDPEEMVKAWPR